MVPDESYDNPFEFTGMPNVDRSDSSVFGSDPELARLMVPPVKSSYWIGAGAIWFMSFTPCWISVLGAAPTVYLGLGPFVDLLAGFILLIAWFSVLLFFAVPFSLMRLRMHRQSIARAIEQQTYPGRVEFDFMYLVYSLVLTSLSLMGGGILFLGICTGLFMVTEPLKPIVGYLGLPFLALDGIISLIATFFLIRLGVPKYS